MAWYAKFDGVDGTSEQQEDSFDFSNVKTDDKEAYELEDVLITSYHVSGAGQTEGIVDSADLNDLGVNWQQNTGDGDDAVDGSDFNIWNDNRFTSDTSADSDEPGLPGVTIYADLNDNYDTTTTTTTFDGDFII